MNLFPSYRVHAKWIPSGFLFLYAQRTTGGTVDGLELKHRLFAWHEASFYGTFLDIREDQALEGVLLPASMALDYFCQQHRLVHGQLEWSDELQSLIRLAPWVREALERESFIPDYSKWKQGQIGWKLELTDSSLLPFPPLVKDWSDWLISEKVRDQPELAAALKKLQEPMEAYVSKASEGEDTVLWLDEEDWLIAIGWKQDPRPFRTCLQLLEPEQEQGWRLAILLQDREQPATLIAVNDQAEPLEPGTALPEAWQSEIDRAVGDVQQWLHVLPSLRDKQEPHRLRRELSHDEAWDFLTGGSLRLAEAGFAVFLPAWWDRVRRMKPRVKARLSSSAAPSPAEPLLGTEQLMQFDWRLALGEVEMEEKDFLQLVEQNRRLIQFRGNWVLVDPAWLRKIRETMEGIRRKKGLSFRDVLELHLKHTLYDPNDEEDPLGGELRIELELNEQLEPLIRQLQRESAVPLIEPPSLFRGSLRPYQLEGASWMLFLRRFGLGGCLADDMGLGKTIQWITYLLHVKEHERVGQPSLLICPTSVLGNWQKELQRFAPDLRIGLHYGVHRLKGEAFKQGVQQADLVLTSYNLAHIDLDELESVEWDSVCLDEAQNIKNPQTKQAMAVRRLESRHRIALTGTPVENRLTELWSIFHFLNPGFFGSLRQFSTTFATAIDNKETEATHKLQRLIRPFLLRRVKKDPAIQLDLPDKYEVKTYISLTAEQATLYENYIQSMFSRLESLTGMQRRGLILSSLTKLKQLCNHPALLQQPFETTQREAHRSNKVERLLEMVSELRQDGDRCLIFTQFVETGKLLQQLLESHLEEPVPFLHGGTSKAMRDTMISRFQQGETWEGREYGIFLLSLKAGGTGLNLTAANHVFHFDRWWNPAVENQATDRAFRIGQTRNVQVYKFVTLGTLEERIDEMIERKQQLSQQIIGSGESWITELSTDELQELFQLRKEWVDA
ncbi:DEAD/DEAH box helicase [Paenibacillus senegalensis]|uniref:DEAD/DEAH box helicase n=1 Tax=Paenibacillus senegalensis TaxID=1465766 RepID=UPI00028817A6|nr:DEAD/DEAH box helicase [Paenibacillus senegalensis]